MERNLTLDLTVAAAQTLPKADVAANLDDHVRLITVAARHGAHLVAFPEMSLTGYLREGARAQSFSPDDRRLDAIVQAARRGRILVVAGAPIALDGRLYIGSFIVHPDSRIGIYTKQFLHSGEEICFGSRADLDPHPQLAGELLSFAICADITHAEHADNAAQARSSLYVASIFYSVDGIARAHATLQAYARKHGLAIVMSSFGGACWGMDAGGKSAVWSPSGELVHACQHRNETLVLARRQNGVWTGEEIADERSRDA